MKTCRPRLSATVDLEKYLLRKCKPQGDGCLVWIGAILRNAPVINLRGLKTRSVRQLLWAKRGRVLRSGWIFCRPDCHAHCVEPQHQCYRSRSLVMRDAAKSGGKLDNEARRIALTRYARANRSSLDAETVARMRERYDETGNAAQVGREFNVDHRSAHAILRHKRWRATTPFSSLIQRTRT